jgi:hypothetical protein
MSRFIVVLLAAVTSASCQEATQPAMSAAVSVSADSIVGSITDGARSIRWIEFAVPASITNHGPSTLLLYPCHQQVEELVDGEWRTAWSPFCTTQMHTPLEIPPGGAYERVYQVTASVSGPGGPDWNGEALPGTYRLTVGLVPRGHNGMIPRAASNSFTLSAAQN